MAKARIGYSNIDTVDYTYELKVMQQERLQKEAETQQILQSSASIGMNAWKMWSEEQGIQSQELISKLNEQGNPLYEWNPEYEEAGFFKRIFTPGKERVREIDYDAEPGTSDPSVSAGDNAKSYGDSSQVSDANSIYDPNHPSYDPAATALKDAETRAAVNQEMPGFFLDDPDYGIHPSEYSDTASMGFDKSPMDPGDQINMMGDDYENIWADEGGVADTITDSGPPMGSDEWLDNMQKRVQAEKERMDIINREGSELFPEGYDKDIHPSEYSDVAFSDDGDINLDSRTIPADRVADPDQLPYPEEYNTIDEFLNDRARATNELQQAEVQAQIEEGLRLKESAINPLDTDLAPLVQGDAEVSSQTLESINRLNAELSDKIYYPTESGIQPSGQLSLRNAFKPPEGYPWETELTSYGAPKDESVMTLVDKFNRIEANIDAGIYDSGPAVPDVSPEDVIIPVDEGTKTTGQVIPGIETVPAGATDQDFEGGYRTWEAGVAAQAASVADAKVDKLATDIASGEITDLDITDVIKEVDTNLTKVNQAGETVKAGSTLGKAMSWAGAGLSAYDMATNWEDMDEGERILSAASTGTSVAAALGLINPLWGLGVGLLQGGIQSRKRGWA